MLLPPTAPPAIVAQASPAPAASVAPAVGAPPQGSLPPGVAEALAAATSVQVTSMAPTGATIHMTLEMPGRADVTMAMGPLQMRSIAIGDQDYVSINGGAWKHVAFPAGAGKDFAKSMFDGISRGKATILPDRTEDGTTVGAFETTASFTMPGTPGSPPKPGDEMRGTSETTCTYDESTKLLRTCTTQVGANTTPVTLTYSHWNDPANVVTAPL